MTYKHKVGTIMTTLTDHSTTTKKDLNEEVQNDRYYCNNLPDLPKEALLQLPYWIADSEEGGYNLYYWDQNGDYKVRHFNVFLNGTIIMNTGGGPSTDVDAFVDQSYTHCCYGEKMEMERLPSL